MRIKPPTKIIVRKTGKKGRGVFATADIKKGEVIEVCPVIAVPKSQEKTLRKTLLDDYCFPWATQYQPAIVLGFGSLYNHSYTPNIEYDEDVERKAMIFTALRDIKKGEELMSNYNGEPDSKDEVWFKVK